MICNQKSNYNQIKIITLKLLTTVKDNKFHGK